MGRRMNINYSKLCLLILACTVAYNEYGAYWVCHARWPRLPSLDGDQVIMCNDQILSVNNNVTR